MPISASKIGDLYLLFHQLPFDFDKDLPLDLGPGVCLDSTPQYLLDNAEPALADYVLPGYHLSGTGLNTVVSVATRRAPRTSAHLTLSSFLY